MSGRVHRLVPAALLLAVALTPGSVRAGCFLCPCGGGATYTDVGTCNANCKPTLGCFDTICGPFRPAADPTFLQDAKQRYLLFENLTDCYGVTAQPTDTYNCIAWSAGDTTRWVWFEVDSFYGDANGVVEVADFDSFYKSSGYGPSPSCALEAGKEKVALFGKRTTDPRYPDGWEPTHAARQAAASIPGGDWWESKEGKYKQIIHRLNDLAGRDYGEVIKCYERAQ
jgi:hypothetical protein